MASSEDDDNNNMPVDSETANPIDAEGEEDDDDVDEAPVFLNPGDAVEVEVDDDMPMEENEEEEGGGGVQEETMAPQPIVEDTSRVKLATHTGPVFAVATHYSPKANALLILSGGGDDRAFLHHVGATTESKLLEHAHSDSVSSVAFNLEYLGDGGNDNDETLLKSPRLAAVGGYDGAIVLYDPDTGSKLQQLEGPTDVEWLCFHPKGGTVLLAGSASDNTIWMFHIPMKKCLQVFVGHESAVTCGSFSPDGKWALTGSSDGSLRVWAPRTGASKHIFRFGEAGLTCMSVNGGQDGQLVMVGAEDGQAHICHVGTLKVISSVRHFQVPTNLQADDDDDIELPMSVEAVGFAPLAVNPNWCATGGVDGTLKIWDLANNCQCRQICKIPSEEEGGDGSSNGGITRLQWHPTSPLVFTSSTNGSVYLWDARNGQLLHTMTGSADVANDLAVSFTDQGKRAIVVTGCDDNMVRVHDVDIVALSSQSTGM
jgi:ribosome assembly protein SQT1